MMNYYEFNLYFLFSLIIFYLHSSSVFSENATGRIVGGKEAEISEVPYLASYHYDGYGHLCSATFITRNVALTAAHCTDVLDVTKMSVRINSNYVDKEGIVLRVKSFKQHELFEDLTNNHDISLLFFEEDILSLVPEMRLSKLATVEPKVGSKTSIYGWGKLKDNGKNPDKLRKAVVPLITREECQKRYNSSHTNSVITENMMCTYTWFKDACQGDSGGPLLDSDGAQIGVISWGIKCAKYPGVHVNLIKERDWIIKNLNLNTQ